jgi:predicted Rossmann fold flavoprotein
MKRIVIIGGGAAGFFSAIRIAERHPDFEVIILERGKEVLQKVKISGGGRCNVTHACWTPKELVKFYPRGSKALLGPFHKFGCGDTVDWFEKRGVPLKIEDDGRMFPKSNSSQSIMDCLLNSAKQAAVKILYNQRVETIRVLDNKQFEIKAKDIFIADSLVITAGSSTAIWAVMENLGHSIKTPVPSLFTFNIKDKRIAELAGLSVNNAFVNVEGQKELNASGPLLITHWGLSGPGILRLSAWGARWMHEKNYEFTIKINWVHSEGNAEQVREKLFQLKTEWAKKMVISNPLFSIPTRLWQNLCSAADIEKETNWANLTKSQLNKLLEELCASCYKVTGKSTNKEEFVTAGGVNTDEINFTKFESKIIPNLYLAGEILDIDALTGGFNFQAAWTAGWIIGENI